MAIRIHLSDSKSFTTFIIYVIIKKSCYGLYYLRKLFPKCVSLSVMFIYKNRQIFLKEFSTKTWANEKIRMVVSFSQYFI